MAKMPTGTGIEKKKLDLKIPAPKLLKPETPKRALENRKPVFPSEGSGGKIVRKKPF